MSSPRPAWRCLSLSLHRRPIDFGRLRKLAFGVQLVHLRMGQSPRAARVGGARREQHCIQPFASLPRPLRVGLDLVAVLVADSLHALEFRSESGFGSGHQRLNAFPLRVFT